MNYWEECISEAFDEIGIAVTKEQIATVAGIVEGSAENYGMAHGHECIPDPQRLEIERLKKDLVNERSKIVCEECKGKGGWMTYFGTFQSRTTCPKCKGAGIYLP